MLKGQHTGLRALEEKDLSLLLEWRNRPEYRRYFREFRELSSADQKTWYESINRRDSNVRMFAIIRLSDGELLGACGLCYIDSVNRNCDLSLYIGRDGVYIDEKYAPDAARTLMKYGFEELGIHRIWAEIYDIDKQKEKFFGDLGFKLDGRHRETHWSEGRWCDSLFFSFLESDR